MSEIEVRKGMPSTKLSREEFDRRFRSRFSDPAFEPLEAEISAMTAAAWDGYTNSRKIAANPQSRRRLCRSGLRPCGRRDQRA